MGYTIPARRDRRATGADERAADRQPDHSAAVRHAGGAPRTTPPSAGTRSTGAPGGREVLRQRLPGRAGRGRDVLLPRYQRHRADSDEFADALLAEEQVAVVPGSGFGLVPLRQPQGLLGASPATSWRNVACDCASQSLRNVLREGVARLARFITRHTGRNGQVAVKARERNQSRRLWLLLRRA